jgi:hypothetical protein
MRATAIALLVVAACATTGADRGSASSPGEEVVKGGIAWVRQDDLLIQESIWTETRVAAGPRGGPATAWLDRQPDGTWRTGGVAVLTAQDSRITGPSVSVTYTRIPGGFRLTGLWFGKNVDLTVDAQGATAHARRYTRNAQGAFVSSDMPNVRVLLLGEAGRLDDPPWPYMAFTALCGGWGL